MNKTQSIPVIGTSVVNSTYWVTRLLMSIDYDVDNFVIINNNGRGELDQELENLKNINHKFVKKITVTHLPSNIGCGGAWNLIIKCYMNSPYWIMANDEIAFGPGILEEIANKTNNDPSVGLIHGNPGDFGVGSWDLFLIRDVIIKTFGLFDENLYPAYCEDADYIMRFMHRPIKKIVSLENRYYHKLQLVEGNGYYDSSSQTQHTSPDITEKLEKINSMNIDYLTKKWGPGWRTCLPTALPFENEVKTISQTTYDLDFVRSKNLGY